VPSGRALVGTGRPWGVPLGQTEPAQSVAFRFRMFDGGRDRPAPLARADERRKPAA
jgi:hypothetical protein